MKKHRLPLVLYSGALCLQPCGIQAFTAARSSLASASSSSFEDGTDSSDSSFEESSRSSSLGDFASLIKDSSIEVPELLDAGDVSKEHATAETPFIHGFLGTAPWKIEDGLLFIGPGAYDSPGHAEGEWPWHPYRDQISRIRCSADFEASGDFSNAFSFETSDLSLAADYSRALESISLPHWDTSKVTRMSRMFSGSSNLKSIDLTDWSTDSCTDLSYMFSGCSLLGSLDVSQWNTARVSNFTSLFDGCRALQIEGIEKLPVDAATTFSKMFAGCITLESLDLSGWNTSNVTNLSHMFQDCSGLKELIVNGWDTSNAVLASGFLENCSSLAAIDLSGWYTPSLRSLDCMFSRCCSLKSVNLTNLDTSSARNLMGMFSMCDQLVDVSLPAFSPSGSLNNLFHGCSALKHLNLSGWNTKDVTSIARMFNGCSSLRTLNLAGWNTSNVRYLLGDEKTVFDGCDELHVIALQVSASSLLSLLPQAKQAAWYREKEGPSTIEELSLPDSRKPTLFFRTGASIDQDAKILHLNSEYPQGVTPEASLEIAGIDLRNFQDYYTRSVTVGAGGACTLTFMGLTPLSGTLRAGYQNITGSRKDITCSSVDNIVASADYTGSPIIQNPILYLDGVRLEENQDYLLSYQSNISPGTASLIISGISGYYGTIRIPFTIVKKPNPKTSIQIARVVNIDPEYEWTGKAIEPKPVVIIGSSVLNRGIDYELEWIGGTDPGFAQVCIRGINAYTGTLYCGYVVVKPEPDPIDLSKVQVDGLPSRCIFEGRPVIYDLKLSYEGSELVKNTDYTIWYENNCAPGQAVVHLKGLGLYCGERSISFTILAPKEDDFSDSTHSSDSSSSSNSSSDHSSGSSSDHSSGSLTDTSAEPSQNPSSSDGSSSAQTSSDKPSSADPSSMHPSADTPSSLRPSADTGNSAPSSSNTADGSSKDSSSDRPSPLRPSSDSSSSSTSNQTKPAVSLSMYRLYNPNSGEHFYTASGKEKNVLIALGWKDEGIGWKAPSASDYPVFRLYNPNAGDHHYTLDQKEKDALVRLGWKYEGIGWYSQNPASGRPLYRQYNPNAISGSHNYTLSIDENNHLITLGWKAEGISWYGMP